MFESQSAEVQVLARLDQVLAELGALTDDAAGARQWRAAARAGVLARLDRLAGALATVRGRVLVAEQAVFTPTGGDRDLAAARARATRAGLGAARREVAQAQTLDLLPVVASAVGTGRVPVAHLDALAKVAAGAGERAAAALAAPEGQDRLVRLAERLSVTEFAGAVARLVASYDPAALEASAARQHAERFLHVTHTSSGTYLKGRVSRVAGEHLRVALASMNQAPDGDRSKAQADADALMLLVQRATSGMAGVRPRRTGPDGRCAPDPEQDAADARVSGVAARPTVSILVPAETFAEVLAAQRRAREQGTEPWWAPAAPATVEDGTPISMSELAVALCDCDLGRIVLDAESLPLDVGRASRLFTPAQRRTIIIRDRACAWNGCDTPAAWCDTHHIRWWDRDTGPTSVENGVLLCSHHHHVVHQQDLSITRLPRPPAFRAGSGRLPDEPMRNRFTTRPGHIVNAPPDGGTGVRTDRQVLVGVG